ncbi:MAG: type II/IV secretion system ATPase subunit [Candidatus Aenigmarchaeota archaeon]|nr:type II/IV secretion system ATPase subunit [Candidatus Aenigmarchaeota archaeon]
MFKNIISLLRKRRNNETKISFQSKTRAGQLLEIMKKGGGIKGKEDKKLLSLNLKGGKTKYPKFQIFPKKKLIVISGTNPRYPLIDPYAFAWIRKDPITKVYVYNVLEPVLTESDKKILERLKNGLIEVIDIPLTKVKNEDKLLEFLEEKVQMLLEAYDITLPPNKYLNIMYYIYRDFVGLNEIEPIMHDPYVEDFGVDGVGVPLYVIHQKFGSLKTNIVFNNEEKLRDFVIKLAERSDRYISYAEPLLDGTLADGSRVQATLASDVTTRGPTFTIRKFRSEPFTPVDMIMLKTASSELMAYLWYTIELRKNILICGGTSTGKTSFLNAISLFIPIESKIVSIEDTREISLPHEHWIPGLARPSFTGTKIGEVSMFDLLRESFRQNPDYLIVGEVRGKEAYVMFQGMASGHPSFSTMHAASLDDVIKRLRSPPIELSPSLIETLDIVIVMIHAKQFGKSMRRVKEIMEIQSINPDTGEVDSVKAFGWIPADDQIEYKGYSWVLNKISIDEGVPMRKVLSEISLRKKVLEWLVERGIRDLNSVSKYIVMYQTDRERLLKLIEKK